MQALTCTSTDGKQDKTLHSAMQMFFGYRMDSARRKKAAEPLLSKGGREQVPAACLAQKQPQFIPS